MGVGWERGRGRWGWVRERGEVGSGKRGGGKDRTAENGMEEKKGKG